LKGDRTPRPFSLVARRREGALENLVPPGEAFWRPIIPIVHDVIAPAEFLYEFTLFGVERLESLIWGKLVAERNHDLTA
jgi:hypothetical protein